ncbi:hypothetical protein GCM10029992_48700 [Glycomyces albus]
MLTTLMRADGGTARVAGHDVATEQKAVRSAIGVTGQFAAVDELLTGRENLQLMVDLSPAAPKEGKRIVADLLERFELTEAAGKPASTYSGGMRRKLDLAMTLVGSPRIIFLDEPTTGLDPRSRRTMWSIIRELVADGVTVFLTTQYLEEADQLADRIAVLDQGAWSPRAPPTNSSAASPEPTSGSGSPAPPNSTRPNRSSPAPPGTTRRCPCACPATRARGPCGPCSTGSTSTPSTPKNSRSTRPTSTTSSSP